MAWPSTADAIVTQLAFLDPFRSLPNDHIGRKVRLKRDTQAVPVLRFENEYVEFYGPGLEVKLPSLQRRGHEVAQAHGWTLTASRAQPGLRVVLERPATAAAEEVPT
jgi:hypothetical protein